MATIKSFTSLEQSKKLAEILSLESADMVWEYQKDRFVGEPDNVLLASFSKSHLDFHRDIEYTRTDAFIEKACEWLENNLQGIVGGSIYMDDFRKYMKGE